MVLVAFTLGATGLAGCAGEGPSTDASVSNATGAGRGRDLLSDPGDLIEQVPAGPSIPEVVAWEVYAAPEGITVRGITNEMRRDPRTGGTIAVAPIVYAAAIRQKGSGLASTSQAISVGPGINYTLGEVLAAIRDDVQAFRDQQASQDDPADMGIPEDAASKGVDAASVAGGGAWRGSRAPGPRTLDDRGGCSVTPGRVLGAAVLTVVGAVVGWGLGEVEVVSTVLACGLTGPVLCAGWVFVEGTFDLAVGAEFANTYSLIFCGAPLGDLVK